MIASERDGELRQSSSRFNGEVNGYCICDRGRFGYEFVNSKNRIRKVSSRMHEQTGNTPTLLEAIASEIKKGEALGIGSPRASLESNFALRGLVGEDNFYHGVPDTHFALIHLYLRNLQEDTVQTTSLRDVEQAEAILLHGYNHTETDT